MGSFDANDVINGLQFANTVTSSAINLANNLKQLQEICDWQQILNGPHRWVILAAGTSVLIQYGLESAGYNNAGRAAGLVGIAATGALAGYLIAPVLLPTLIGAVGSALGGALGGGLTWAAVDSLRNNVPHTVYDGQPINSDVPFE